jgi:hypothetical protein
MSDLISEWLNKYDREFSPKEISRLFEYVYENNNMGMFFHSLCTLKYSVSEKKYHFLSHYPSDVNLVEMISEFLENKPALQKKLYKFFRRRLSYFLNTENINPVHQAIYMKYKNYQIKIYQKACDEMAEKFPCVRDKFSS